MPALQAGWWKLLLLAEVLCLAQRRRALRGAAPVPVTFFLLAQKESHQRKKAPRFAAATSQARSGVPVLLDQPGGLRNSRTICSIAHKSGVTCQRSRVRSRGSPSARPKPRAGLRCSAANRGPTNKTSA